VVVPQYSQLGGLQSSAYNDHYNFTTHSAIFGLPPTDHTETNSLVIQARVIDLLLSNDHSLFATGFPAPGSVSTPFDNSTNGPLNSLTKNAMSTQSAAAKSSLNKAAIAKAGLTATNYSLQITSPTASAVLNNSGTDSLTLTLQFTNPGALANSLFMIPGVGFFTIPNSAPYSTKIALPKTLTGGSLKIAAMANDTSGNIYADTLSITIQSSDTLKSFTVSPSLVQLDSSNRVQSLSVNGLFTNGQDTTYRDITSGAAGTLYATLLKSTIASVTTDGQVSGIKAGTDTIVITNRNKIIKIPVAVNPDLFKVAKLPDTINLRISSQVYGNPPFVLNGTVTSGEPITYKLISGPVSLANGIVTINGAGVAAIVASSPADAYFNAAANDTVSFTVQKASQVITFSPLNPVVDGQADFAPSATASSGLPVSYASGNTAIATIVNNKIHLINTGSVTITALQAGNVNYNPAANVPQTLTVNPSPNTNLASLVISAGILAPAFASTTTAYTASVSNAITSITVKPVAGGPSASIKVNGSAVISGSTSGGITLNVGLNTITIVVTAQDGVTKKTYTVAVTRAPSNNAHLLYLSVQTATLSPGFAYKTFSYTAQVPNSTGSVTVSPSLLDLTAAVKVNGTAVTNKTASGPIGLAVGANTITVLVTAQDGVTTQTYTITITRAPSGNDNLSALKISAGTLKPAFATGTISYTASVGNGVTSLTVTPTSSDPTAMVKVNGTAVISGIASGAIALNVGLNAITTVVTAQDGVTKKTYTVTVTRAPSSNAYLLYLSAQTATLSPGFAYKTFSYTSNVHNTTSSVTVTPSLLDTTARVKVNGTAVTNKTPSGPIALAVGANTITLLVTAQDAVTTQTYTITITRAVTGADGFDPGISVTRPGGTPGVDGDGIIVHQGVSPNGDGIDDFLQIDNIANYPDNKLSIMNRDGQLIYEAKGYDNGSTVFDGHSNKNGQMQLPGTYFYQLDYTINGIAKRKTGFLVLKY
jgi:gliding motility-associated-like protein